MDTIKKYKDKIKYVIKDKSKDISKSKNTYKNIFPLKLNNCSYFLKKNGTFIYYPVYINNNYICILNNYLNLDVSFFPILKGKDENDILNRLLILKFLQNNDVKYYLSKSTHKKPIKQIWTFKEKNIEIFTEYLFYIKNIKKIINGKYDSNNLLAYNYILNKLVYNKLSDNKNFIQLFYKIYINLIKKDLFDKYNISYNNFSNYNKLYLFLKKNGYVNYYYKSIMPKIIKLSKKLENKFKSDKINYDKFKDKKIQLIKNYRDIDLFKLINTDLNKKFDKTSIKNKFIELCKKYNI